MTNTKDHNNKKLTKNEKLDLIGVTYNNELRRNYAKALAQGFQMAFQDIIDLLLKDKDFDVLEYCKNQLGLVENSAKGIDAIYDKRKERASDKK